MVICQYDASCVDFQRLVRARCSFLFCREITGPGMESP